MEPAVCYDGFTAILYRNTGACPVDSTFSYGGGVCGNGNASISLISPRVSYREFTDVHVVADDGNDRSIILSVDDGIILLLTSEINRFIENDRFIIQSVEYIDGVAVCCMEDAIVDVLIGGVV